MQVLRLRLMPPGEIVADAPAPMTATPRALSGKFRQIDFTAGGKVAVTYADIVLQRAEQHLYWNRLAALLNGGGGVIVPIVNDLTAPGGDAATGITHSDGTTFSDGSGYAQTGITARLVGDHILNAGTLTFSVAGALEALSGGEWFAIRHPNKHWRAYRIWIVDAVDETGANPVYTVGIQPPLREAAVDGIELDFTRPRFVGQLPDGQTLPWGFSGHWRAQASVSFVERFELD